MRQTTGTRKSPGEKIVKDIQRATRKQYSSEENIRNVLELFAHQDVVDTPEIITLRLTARGLLPKAEAAMTTAGDAAGPKGGGSVEGVEVPVYAQEALGGDALVGRMVIEDAYTTL
jgi:hypothetical protein